MSHPLLIPLDGSPLAEHALPYATALARALDVRVILLHVRGPVLSNVGAPDLHAIADQLRAEGVTTEIQTPLLPNQREVGQVILETATQVNASLIVMATHGRGGLGRLIYGSVADYVLRQTTMPVMLVPPTTKRAWPAERPPRILVPVDGSETAEAVLQPLQQIAGSAGAEVILLRVVDRVDFLKPHGDDCDVCRQARARGEEPDIEPVRARQYLDRLSAQLGSESLTVATQQEVGQASATIINVARERGVDLIAMATQGHGGLTRVVLGSVANETLRQSNVPLLLVRP